MYVTHVEKSLNIEIMSEKKKKKEKTKTMNKRNIM